MYNLLEELINHNDAVINDNNDNNNSNKTQDFLKQAKIMFPDDHSGNNRFNLAKNKYTSSSKDGSNDQSFILQRLDRMVRAIKEYDHIRTSDHSLSGF